MRTRDDPGDAAGACRLLEGLRDRNAAEGYACLKQLLAESGRTAAVYPHWDALIALTEEESAYLRARGLRFWRRTPLGHRKQAGPRS